MTEQRIRILHLTVQRALSAGQRKQLSYEARAAGNIKTAQWDTLAFHTGVQEEAFERPIPAPYRGLLLRWLYGWKIAKALAPQYDFVLLRHMVFDPFAPVFAPLVPNRLGVHHAKEIEELPLISPGFKGWMASVIERYSGAIAVQRSIGILGVTRELAHYQRDLRAPGKPSFCYPNGIHSEGVSLATDERQRGRFNLVFICGTFSAWHGLDRIVKAVADAPGVPENVQIHLVGKLSAEQVRSIGELGPRAGVFKIHGFLPTEAYQTLLDQADAGIGSLAMDRQNLNEGSTLKVRELLAAGIPVISGHRDTALPNDFEFYRVLSPLSLEGILHLCEHWRIRHRAEVRQAALPYIEKEEGMRAVVDWLRDEFLSEDA